MFEKWDWQKGMVDYSLLSVVKMFASLTGIADKFSSFIREPVTPLGNCVHDTIYATSYGSSNYQKVGLFLNMRLCNVGYR